MSVDLYIRDKRVIKFDESESIQINRKTKDYRDIEKLFSDYSESFTVPGEPNNHIFQHYYDADVEGGFDARIKQPAKIFVNQELYKEGEIKLLNVSIENNRIANYKIQFFTIITQLVDEFGEDELNDLGIEEEYLYERQGVEFKLKAPDNEDLIFPLISYKRRYLYETQTTIEEDIETDISKNTDAQKHGIDWRELKPAIKVRRIIDEIQNKYGVNFIGDIFTDNRYLDLFMSVNGQSEEGGDGDPQVSNVLLSEYNNVDVSNAPGFGVPYTNYDIEAQITPDSGFEDVEYTIIFKVNGAQVYQSTQSGTETLSYTGIVNTDEINVEIIVQASAQIDFSYNTELVGIAGSAGSDLLGSDSGVFGSVSTEVNAGALFPEMKVADFVKSLIKMFNLVIIPENVNTFRFENLQEWYSDGNIVDITPYVDNQTFKLNPGRLIKEIDFSFENHETFLSAEFKDRFNRGYGNREEKLEDENGNQLQGDVLKVELPYEKPIFEKINSNVQYGYYVDEKQDEFQPKPSLFYAPLYQASGLTLYTVDRKIEQFGQPFDKFRMPKNAHLNIFGLSYINEFDEFTGNATLSNLYDEYYKDYVEDLYSKRRRNYNLEAKIPFHVMHDINLNDRLIIQGRRYIINSLRHDLTNNMVKLDLSNDIFEGTENVNQTLGITTDSYVVDNQGGNITTYATGQNNVGGASSGESWISANNNGKQINITIDRNTSGSSRFGEVNVKFDDISGTLKTINILQNA